MKNYLFIIALALYTIDLCYAQGPDLIWAENTHGPSCMLNNASEIDSLKNLYNVGRFMYNTDFDPGPSNYNMTAMGVSEFDIYIQKLDSSGGFVWAGQIGDNGPDQCYDIVIDNKGYIYMTGYFVMTADFDIGPGNFDMTAVNFDAYILKMDTAGNFIWAKQFTGPGFVDGYNIVTDNKGYIYIVGKFNSTIDFDPNAGIFNITSVGGYDMYISKLDTSGNMIWTKQFGSNIDDSFSSLSLDNSNNIILVGGFSAPIDFDPGTGIYELAPYGGSDIFVLKLDQDGNFIWADQMGGLGNDRCKNTVQDVNNNIYISGTFELSADFNPGPLTTLITAMGNSDVFLSKLDSSGNFIWAKHIGGNGSDETHTISIDKNNNIYMTGCGEDTIDIDPGPDVILCYAENSAFIIKTDTAGQIIWNRLIISSEYAKVSSLIPDNDTNLFMTGYYTYSADLDPGSGYYILDAGTGDRNFATKWRQCSTGSIICDTACYSYMSPSGNYIYTISGIYTDTLQNVTGCDSIISIRLEIIDFNLSLSLSGDTLSSNETGVFYQWVNCDNGYSEIPYEVNQYVIIQNTGNYAIVLSNGLCQDTSDCYYVYINKVQNNNTDKLIVLYPNPSNGNFTMNLGLFPNEKLIEVIDITGSVVYQTNHYSDEFIHMNLNILPGIYFIKITDEIRNTSVMTKIVIFK